MAVGRFLGIVLAAASAATGAPVVGTAAGPSWSTALSVINAPTGSYRKQTTLLENGHVTVQAEEFLDYDLKAKWLDRRITRIGDIERTRDKPALRFVYRPGRYLMWNPNVEQKCGTPWVQLSEAALRALNGGNALDFFSSTEPASVLRTLKSAPRAIRRDPKGVVFRVLVPGDTGLPASSEIRSHPEAVAKLHRGTTTAFVHVASVGGPIRITVDITKAVETIGGQSTGGARALQVWVLERPPHRLDRSTPSKVAKQTCLG